MGAVRGRIFVIIQGSGVQHYPSNAGAFVYGNPENPDCIFLLYDDPFQCEELTKQMRTTHMIRTRTDAGTIEARANDYSRLKKSLEIGAQILSTDYYKKDPNIGPFVIPFVGFLGD